MSQISQLAGHGRAARVAVKHGPSLPPATSAAPSSTTTSCSTPRPPPWSSPRSSSPAWTTGWASWPPTGPSPPAMWHGPLGGIIFGHFGDRLGRKNMLIISMLVMGIASTLIGLVPGAAWPDLGCRAARDPSCLPGHRRRRRVGRRRPHGAGALGIGQTRLRGLVRQRRRPHRRRPGHPGHGRIRGPAQRAVPGLGLAGAVPALLRPAGRGHVRPAQGFRKPHLQGRTGARKSRAGAGRTGQAAQDNASASGPARQRAGASRDSPAAGAAAAQDADLHHAGRRRGLCAPGGSGHVLGDLCSLQGRRPAGRPLRLRGSLARLHRLRDHGRPAFRQAGTAARDDRRPGPVHHLPDADVPAARPPTTSG